MSSLKNIHIAAEKLYSLFWMCLWLFGICILLSFVIRFCSGDSFRFVRVTGYIMPWLLIVLVPGLIAAWLSKRKCLALLLSIPSFFICISYSPHFLNCSKVANAEGPYIKVMSYNIWNQNRTPAAAIELIRREKPDILLLQEVNSDHFQYLITHLNSLYGDTPLSSEYVPEMKQAVLSRYPMFPIGADIEKGRAQKVRIETFFGPITVINVHIFNFPWQRRHRQLIELVKEDIAKIQGPIILGGDLNTNDQSEAYRITERYLENAHRESGCGLGFTFPSQDSGFRIGRILSALIRIDHIFYSDHFYSRNSKTLNESGGSDHYPVVAELIHREQLWLSDRAMSGGHELVR